MTPLQSLQWVGIAMLACVLLGLGDVALLKHPPESAIRTALIGLAVLCAPLVLAWAGAVLSFLLAAPLRLR